MIFLYLALILLLMGLSFWAAGAVLHKKAIRLDKKNRKKQQEKAMRLGTIAKILLIVAAFFFVAGILMLNGIKTTNL
jgi:uncharacterized membrane protein YphA (DoxX/SURF4 family)